MFDVNKIYTAKEIEDAYDSNFVGFYYLNSESKPFDFYAYRNKKLSEKENKLYEEGKLGFFEINNMANVDKILNEALDRVWYDRNKVGTVLEEKGIPEAIRKGALKNKARIEKTYNINEAEIDDFYHGYWSGILAVLRYLKSGDSVSIDDLRSGNDLLDT